MNEWSDAEISRRLALAIGWPATYQIPGGPVYVHANPSDRFFFRSVSINGRVFDYRDPAVIWTIAERFGCFPSKVKCGDTTGWLVLPGVASDIQKTSAKAVALAVIKAKEQT